MEAPGGDADFRPEAELAAVSILRRRVPENDGAIHRGEKRFGALFVFRDDALGVVGRVLVDMSDSALNAVNRSQNLLEAILREI